MKINKIAVAGTGYVGLSLATLLAQHNEVVAVDVIQEKVDLINNKKSPIQDKEIEEYLATKPLHLTATTDGRAAYKDADLIIIATPTNYDPKLNFFDTKYVEQVIELVLQVNPNAIMVIKSTIPVGYTKSVREKYNINIMKNKKLGGTPSATACPPGSAVPGLAHARHPRPFVRRAHSLPAVACFATLP